MFDGRRKQPWMKERRQLDVDGTLELRQEQLVATTSCARPQFIESRRKYLVTTHPDKVIKFEGSLFGQLGIIFYYSLEIVD